MQVAVGDYDLLMARRNIHLPSALPVVGALLALGAVMALAVAGWSAQGEAIFVSMLEAGWRNCF
ncbi:hypothetical protein Sa4125_30990 [Aureimonas sp. SA4125]|uniref:hypothetical protein n=1 Tax=Aureimonas sp. SA4125 TaxID=2826993 RepID=UPI001CC509F5|nr:hypothetical protein [Aureimonas sp. SA4125]BDA85557.1 hypothetical protein Sa4125_30990 [Aureimonas sp. SA4125]